MLLQLIRPRGGTVSDGIRLAALNGFGLIVSALLIGFISLILRWFDLPALLIDFGLIVILVAAAVVFWFRYASAHGKAARALQRHVRTDVFGAISAIPFALVGLLLASSGLFSLFLAMVTFSLSRAGGGLQRLLFAVIFLGLAATNIIIARAASD
jgi:hypothetical protein